MLFKKLREPKRDLEPKRRLRDCAVITAEVTIEGNVFTNSEVQVNGTINGDVRARLCTIELSGVVCGELFAEEAVIHGRVLGPIRAVHVHILAGAHVEGDVISQTLSVENGAYLDGKIRRSEDPFSEPLHPYDHRLLYADPHASHPPALQMHQVYPHTAHVHTDQDEETAA